MPVVGRNVPHDSAVGHVTGESLYVDDIAPAVGEVVVDFLWSPFAHARIRSLDIEPARSVPGVVGLYTYRDLHHNLFGPIYKDEILLTEDECMFRGQPIVVIAAENARAIGEAKKGIRIDLEELKPILTIDDAIAARSFFPDPRMIRRGDPDRTIDTADHILEGVFENQGQDHFYLESQAALAYPGELGQLTVHSSTQNPTEVQEVVAHLLGLEMNQVVVLTKRMGGGFGGKECQATHPAVMVALVAQRTKRPARIVFNKDDDMHVTGKRHPFQNRYRVGFRRSGEIVAAKFDLYSDGGAYADLSPAVMARAMTHVDNAYYIPHVEIHGTICRTNMPPNTAFRGFGGPQGVITIENVMQEIAAFLKKDALEVRRVNCYQVETRNTTPYGEVVERNTLPRLFTELPQRCDYSRRMEEVKRFNATSKTQLKGLALTAVKFGISFNTKFLNQANALVNVYLDGSVQVSTGATEMGQGVNTKIRQLVADELGVPLERVIVMITSTEKNNNTSATAASSAADLNGGAALDACRKIKARMAETAKKEIGAKDVVFGDGIVWDKDDLTKKMTFRDLVGICHRSRVPLGDKGFYATPRIDWTWTSEAGNGGAGHPFLYYTMGTACSEVLIDRFTGEMKVLRSDVLMDIGKPINPGVDRGQITGAFIQGMGWLTTEDLRYTDGGELLAHSPTTYKIPNINDLPEIFNVDWIEQENPVNVANSKAVGEPPLLMAISVWCAVKHALSFVSNGDVPKLRVPATCEEILMRMTEYSRPKEVVGRRS
ncbi:MAG TPA: xanthine dehydrogenase molybdopterin binding subunit [Thermoanaerobaculia bacterium]|jgi:xanthine dehydrogenase large subunit|nr:xanthine dehydrogenase molybdopterin binding subunit [Thermoanaerobaculia bacterium]